MCMHVRGPLMMRPGGRGAARRSTLLFQRPGEGGLEICPGRAASSEFAHGDTWLPVPPVAGCITCNLGDMIMRWADDRVQSTFHRVRAPPRGTPVRAHSPPPHRPPPLPPR